MFLSNNKDGASIGANTTIICGNTIGMYSLIGAGTVITKSIKDYSLQVGNPNKQIGWVTKYGDVIPFDYFKNNIYFDKSKNTVYELFQNKLTPKQIENKQIKLFDFKDQHKLIKKN